MPVGHRKTPSAILFLTRFFARPPRAIGQACRNCLSDDIRREVAAIAQSRDFQVLARCQRIREKRATRSG